MQLLNTISTSRTWTRHGVKIAYVIAIVVLLVCLASITWGVRTQLQTKASDYAQQTVAPITQQAARSYRINDVVGANLFGNPNPNPVQKVVQKTTLDLTLEGILSASDASIARAIIKSGQRKSELYSIGENISGAGVSIEEIRSNEVLINRNGAIESLPLKQVKGSSDKAIISYTNGGSGTLSSGSASPAVARSSERIGRSSPKPRSKNGPHRKVRKPNFSGLDRALEKLGEI